ncbi:transcriptional activator NhaR [Azovibrio restrictus]|uniref:transcriptional activator NhaR n=1 Tax=Azovibrio restrictus TaxID=146938 RepID=UPI000407EF2B|nr:transcriptional activator NhaR [Azovibrio restrictus]MCE1184450.1 transcriptional activator NhaR [Rhodocyclales bacterium]
MNSKKANIEESRLNYRHLYYYWMVAKAGSLARAAEQLGLTPQTISAQLSQLEQSIGTTLFDLQGRKLIPTEAGRTALRYADEIFLLGEQLWDSLKSAGNEPVLRLTVGITDVVPKLVAHHLLEPVLHLPERVRLICHEGKFETLLADLAIHKLDVILADRPVGPGMSLRLFSHPLGETDLSFYATAALAERYREGFPQSLDGAPFLLPARNAAVRASLDQWFETHGIRPQVLAEFEDTALLDTFGATGLGVFPAQTPLTQDLARRYDAVCLGPIDAVRDQFFAISADRRIRHPGIEAIRMAGQQRLFQPV